MFKGKNALVTDSTGGIGQVIAALLAGQDCNILRIAIAPFFLNHMKKIEQYDDSE